MCVINTCGFQTEQGRVREKEREKRQREREREIYIYIDIDIDSYIDRAVER